MDEIIALRKRADKKKRELPVAIGSFWEGLPSTTLLGSNSMRRDTLFCDGDTILIRSLVSEEIIYLNCPNYY
jgi:hypothetical protein